MIEIFNFLKEALPFYDSAVDCPFVMQSSSVAPITQACIDQREDVCLYISTCKMLMGINISNISVVIFLRPLNMLHMLIQGAGRGGRKQGDMSGLTNKAVAYILWNNSDISSNVRGMLILHHKPF